MFHEPRRKPPCEEIRQEHVQNLGQDLAFAFVAGTDAGYAYNGGNPPETIRFGGRDLGKGVHTFSAAFTAHELEEVLKISRHVVFNSFGQWRRFQGLVRQYRALRPELQEPVAVEVAPAARVVLAAFVPGGGGVGRRGSS